MAVSPMQTVIVTTSNRLFRMRKDKDNKNTGFVEILIPERIENNTNNLQGAAGAV